MSQISKKQAEFQQEINNLETTIAAIEAQRASLGELVANTALDLLRERLATLIQPTSAAERKRVTVLFADVSGYTALSENLDPEDVANIMNRLFEAVTVEIHRYGGTIDKYAGDAVMALFGAPQALENHEEMSVRAAMAMQQVIQTFSEQLYQDRGFRVQMRIGLNTGDVLAGLVGGLKARSYTVMGDTVNLAARLESSAPVGGILASNTTARKLHAIFEFAPPEKINVKGKSDEITVYLVQGEKANRGRVRGLAGLQAPMIGRETEFVALKSTFTQLVEGEQWGATAVTGSAGLGKSRLQHELIAWILKEHPQTRILMSRCFHHTRTTPYHFLAELMRNLFNLSRDANAETAEQHLIASLQVLQPEISETELQYQLGSLASILGFNLPHNLLQNLEPEQRRDRTFLSLERVFLTAASMKQLLIFIDDLHWADALSLDFLDRILQMIARNEETTGSAMWFILSRPSENQQSTLGHLLALLKTAPHQTIMLTALQSSQAGSLINKLLDQKMPTALRDLITDHAQGNPFYVEEVIRSLIEDGTLKKNGTWKITRKIKDVRIPPSVQDILAARIDRLPPDDKHITQRAAIIGRIFWQQILNDITESPVVEPTLLLLELRQLADRMEESQIGEDWEWVFHHGLIQEVAYSTVPKTTRRLIHKQVAQTLEEQNDEQITFLLPLIAFHFEQGDMPEKAIEYLTKAGDQAASQFANEDAVDYFSRALSLLAQIAEKETLSATQLKIKYMLLLGRADVYHLSGERKDEIADLSQLKALANSQDNNQHRSEVARRYADYYDVLSEFANAVESAQEVVKWADLADDPTLKVSGLNAWAWGLSRQGQFDEARRLSIEAEALARKYKNERGTAVSLAYLGTILFYQGKSTKARDTVEESLALCRTIHDVQRQVTCLNNLVAIYHSLGDLSQAKKSCKDALDVAQTIGDRSKESTILNNLGAMHHALGDLAMARDYNQQAITLAQTLNNRLAESMATTNLGLVLHDLGEHKLAQEYAQRALDIDRAIGDRIGEGYSLTTFGLASEGLNQLDEADKAYHQALTLRRDTGQNATAIDNLAGTACIAFKQDKLDKALTIVQEVLTWIDENGIEGIEYPLRVYLSCVKVLNAANLAEKAKATLDAAKDLLDKKANRISDRKERQAYLENVPVHQQLRETTIK